MHPSHAVSPPGCGCDCSEALAATQRQMQELAGRSRDLEEQHALAAAEAARLQEQVRQDAAPGLLARCVLRSSVLVLHSLLAVVRHAADVWEHSQQ
jgi:hypothetical protein